MTGKSLVEPHGPRTLLGTVIFVRLFGDEGIDKAVRRRIRVGERAATSSAFTPSLQFNGVAARVMPTLGRLLNPKA
jgi:hypothetical protein